jgi:hypothetical protein
MASPPSKTKNTGEQFTELLAVIDNLAASMATMQGNQGPCKLRTRKDFFQTILLKLGGKRYEPKIGKYFHTEAKKQIGERPRQRALRNTFFHPCRSEHLETLLFPR